MVNAEDKSVRQKVFKGVSSQTFVSISTGVVEIISFTIMSRLLTKEDFGYYAAIMAVVTIFSSFSETGIGSAIIQKKGIDRSYINTAFTLSLIFGIFISFALFISSGILADIVADSTMKIPLMLMSITLLLYCLTSVNTSILYRDFHFLKVGIISLFASITTTIVAVVLAINGFGYYAILSKALLTSIMTWALTTYYVHTSFKIELCKDKVRSIIGYSGWLMASVVFRNLSNQADRLLMPRLLSISMLGAYNRPKDFISQISGRINNIFDTVFFPLLSGFQDDLQKLVRVFRESLYFLSLVSAVLFILFFFNASLIIRIFLGEEWLNLKHLFQILSIILYIDAVGRLADCYLRSLAMTRIQFHFRIAETLTKLVSVFVSASWGITGVAIGVVLADIILKIAKLCYVANKINCPYSFMILDILHSFRFLILLVPLSVICYYLLPYSLLGDIIMVIIIVSILSIEFLLLPICVGKKYKNEVYGKIKMKLFH